MEIDKLSHWKSSLENEVESIKKQINSLAADLQRKSQQIELISKLIHSVNTPFLNPGDIGSTTPLEIRAPKTAMPSEVKDHVYQILTDANHPMNIGEIHSEFIRRGYPIPGKGTQFNILVHISRDLKLGKKSRFYRVGRGTYGVHRSNAS